MADREEKLCPSCGRFVGPWDRCGSCGAEVTKRLSLRVVQWGAWALALGGLGLLYAYARMRELPVVASSEITEAMNFAYVRMEGEVQGPARVVRDGERVRRVELSLQDAGGVVRVTAYPPLAEQIARQGLVPDPEDRLSVAGSLRVSHDELPRLQVQSLKHYQLHRAEVAFVKLGDIDDRWLDRRVRTRGRVRWIKAPADGSRRPWQLGLEEDSARRTLTVFASVWEEIPARAEIRRGAELEAVVLPELYRGELQLSLTGAGEILVRGGPPRGPEEGSADGARGRGSFGTSGQDR